jgi:hypothetical protein
VALDFVVPVGHRAIDAPVKDLAGAPLLSQRIVVPADTTVIQQKE